jgi:2-oxoglutarate dehydrogenase E2 component (dihydrolipoamide succinyltransferase)
MPAEIRVPPLGESLVDAVVGQWLKQEGEAVSRGETLVELETDKVNLDVTASDDGVLSQIAKQAGDVVTVGEVLAVLSTDGAAASASTNGTQAAASADAAPAPAEAPAASAANGQAAPEPVTPSPPPAPALQPAAVQPAAPIVPIDLGGAGRAAPAVRRLAEEHHVDLNALPGSGPGGRITREDVLAAIAQTGAVSPSPTPITLPAPIPAPSPQPHPPAQSSVLSPQSSREERVRFTRRRQTIAARLVQAQQTAAMLTTFNEIDMSAVMDLRSRRRDTFKEKHGIGLGFMSFFTKAVVGALKAFPQVNSELQGDELVLKKYYDIGIAVGVEEGLVVPVVRDADRKTFAEIEREIAELATKARDNSLSLAELQGGTFTITNGGIFGSLLSTPILNYPQVGILGMHAIQQRPVVRDGEIVAKPMMYVALSYDHRVVDGSAAVRFLVRIKELVEDPETLLIEG